jgi:hypothetical protein
MMLRLDTGQVDWLPLGLCYPPAARRLARLQLVLAIGGLTALIVSHFFDSHPLMVISGLVYAAATLMPLPILRILERDIVL